VDYLQRCTEDAVSFGVNHGLSVMYVTEDTTRSPLHGRHSRWRVSPVYRGHSRPRHPCRRARGCRVRQRDHRRDGRGSRH
jgi:hypothetical protein